MASTLGKGKIAAVARLLATGTCPERTEEEVAQEKLAAQSIQRELLEADEANLLDEEDMHIFDCMPMVDLLHLVCCNNCKKPVKASQYTAHSERCRSLNWSEEVLKLDGGTGHKKPPRKGRKKFEAANETITFGGNERLGSLDGNDTATLVSVAGRAKLTSSSRKSKRKLASTDTLPVKDGSVRCVGTTNCTGVVVPPEKRIKIAATHLISEGQEALVNVTTNDSIDHQKTSTYYPVPLATKIYYSQRNQRLRFALNHLYNEASEKVLCSESPKLVDENIMLPSQGSSPKDLVHDPSSEPSGKKDAYSLATIPEPDQVLVEGSEHSLADSRGYTSAMGLSNHFLDNNFSRLSLSVDTSSIGKKKSRYHPTSYAYTGNSGTSLGGIQQPSGSVHVV